jgi:hypothetical protein
MTRALIAITLFAGACGGSGAPARSPQQQTSPPGGPATTTSCPAGQIEIESCVVGGMPNEDGTANVSCGHTCSAKPPSGSAAQECQKVSADRYRCTGYAP